MHQPGRKQRGVIGIIEIALFMTVLVAAGYLYWRVSKPDKPVEQAQTTPKQVHTEPSKSAKVPEGFRRFESEALGVAFNYPKDWGVVSIDSSQAGVLEGEGHLINFSMWDDSTRFALISQDYRARSGDGYDLQGSTYDSVTTQYRYGFAESINRHEAAVVNDDGESLLMVSYDCANSRGYRVTGYGSITGHKTLPLMTAQGSEPLDFRSCPQENKNLPDIRNYYDKKLLDQVAEILSSAETL